VNPCNRTSFTRAIEVTNVDKVDLLFMVDNSGSMREEQANLITEIPRLVRILASGDSDGDGMQNFPPVNSLHVGIVSSDMGSGNQMNVRTCTPGLGDDGILRARSASATAPCMATYPSGTFEFMNGQNTDAFAATVGCVAAIGTTGCGFEQQLESPLKALTPSNPEPWTRAGYTPPRFYDAASGLPNRLAGHGTGANNGFIRQNSALAVVLVTDEEDCSVSDYAIFGASDPRFTSIPANVRCNTYSGDPTIVYPVSRYVDGFLGLRRSPGLLIFSAIAGIPPETEAMAAAGNFAGVLANPGMVPRADASGNMLEPSCSTMNGIAYPPIRIVETAAGLAAQGVSVSVSSICSSTFAPAIDAIIAKIASALGGACLPRALNPEPATGRVQCDVLEVLPPPGDGVISDCTMLPGRTFVETEIAPGTTEPRQVCRVNQVDHAPGVEPTTPGWFYDDFTPGIMMNCSATPQRISFTDASPPATGSEIRLSCLQTVAGGGTVDTRCDSNNPIPTNPMVPSTNPCFVGQFCDFGAGNDFCSSATSLPNNEGARLTCDPVGRTCGVACTNDSDCTTAGLVGFVCDPELNGVRAEETGAMLPAGADANAQRNICVNPTCN
jgi:hypothetical protein